VIGYRIKRKGVVLPTKEPTDEEEERTHAKEQKNNS
jgi:hypothetical protein